MSILKFSLAVTGPIFLLLGLGVWLWRLWMLTDAFVNAGSEVVFLVSRPKSAANLTLVGYGLAATVAIFVAIFVALELLSVLLVHPAQDRGVVVQGAFRSNLRIVGLAYCANGRLGPGVRVRQIRNLSLPISQS